MDHPVSVVMIIHEDGKIFGASFPDYLGATTVARDPDTLRTKAAAMLADHLKALHRAGNAVPPPRTLAQLERSPTFRELARTGSVALLDLLVPGVVFESGLAPAP